MADFSRDDPITYERYVLGRDKEADIQAIAKADRRRYNVCRPGGRSAFVHSLTMQWSRHLPSSFCRSRSECSGGGCQSRIDGRKSRELRQEYGRMAHQARISRWSRRKSRCRQRMFTCANQADLSFAVVQEHHLLPLISIVLAPHSMSIPQPTILPICIRKHRCLELDSH